MDGWMDGRMDGWMDGWMDGCMYVCVCMYACETRLHVYGMYIYIYTHGYGSKNRLDRPAVIRTSGTRGLRKGA